MHMTLRTMLLLTFAAALAGPGSRAEGQGLSAVQVGSGWAIGADGGSAALFAAVAVQPAARLGFRTGATWTSGQVVGALEAVIDLRGEGPLFPSYLVIGGGARRSSDMTRAVATFGGGLRARIDRRFDGFIEARTVVGPRSSRGAMGVPLVVGARIRLGTAAR